MKNYITAFKMTQSMFCSLPFPCKNWDENCRPYMLLFLPVVGMEIGVLWIGLDYLLRCLQLSSTIYGLAMCALPYLLTGFMHLDGFMDVTDAIGSYRDLEKRRLILKDSHVGSFAVIWCVFLILAGFSVFSVNAEKTEIWMLGLVPVISRCGSALAIMNLKPMNTSQYASKKQYPKWHSVVLAGVILISIGIGVVLSGKSMWVVPAEVLGYALSLKKAYTSLDGMNGDISGYSICISELCAVAVLALL